MKGPDIPGVVISTQRPLKVQRFTGAHELGHVALGHAYSLDGPEILERGGFSKDLLEVSADSFAAEFLLPKWLLQFHAARQGWGRAEMSNPVFVYQMALRCGASYHATCLALERHKIISAAIRGQLVAVQPRTIKERLLDGVVVQSYYPDVWLLTERDQGLLMEGEPGDLCVLRLKEDGGAGYLWNAAELEQQGFNVLRDQRAIAGASDAIGVATRVLTARHAEPDAGTMSLAEVRPWDPAASAAEFSMPFDLFGKEIGMPRAVRKQLLAA